MGTSRICRPLLWPAVCVIIALLSAKVNADDKCTAGCSGSSAPSPAFVDGTTYTYNFDSVVSVYLTGSDKKETSVKLAGTATVTALGNCAHVLRVQNLAVSGPDGKKYGKPVGIEKTVRFTLQDGQIGSSICTEDDDNQRSINIKRAIISLLQNAHKHSAEVDVFGVCPTEISVHDENDGVVTIHKTRNLNQCAHRERGKHDLLTSIYNPKAHVRSSHLLQSTLSVESKLKVGVVEKAVATEEYLYRPFSIGQNGARARVITKLTLTGQSKGNEAAKPNVPKSIIFENPHPVATEHSNVANVLLSLKSAAQALESRAGEKSASIFAGLVKILRVTNKADLLNVYGQIKSGGAVKDNDLAKRVFLDALLRTGTGDSIEASIKLLKDKELNPIEQRIVFLSLTNARHASSDSLKSVASLLDLPNLPREVYLGVGALAGAYCREHQCHGTESQSEGVAIVSQKLASKLQNCKPKTKKDEDVVIAVLKGIRNIRHIEDSLIDKLSHCVSDANVKTRVKVAALEAFNADPCASKLKTVALNALKNRQLDSEVRIKAYLAVLDCPCPKVANEVKTLLDTEPVIQVGRFIVSSLRAIRASANPDRQAAKDHLGQIHLTNRFGFDNRRYSNFHEFSYNIDTLGAGATVEHSLIFSQNSFLPRSTDFNLTTEIFGHRVNFLEVGVRQGNLERVLEHYLGPKGHLRSTDPQKLYEEALQQIYSVVDKFKERLNAQRSKRDVKQEVLTFAKQIKNEIEGFSGNVELDIFVKLFGTDAIFLSLGDEEISLTGLVDKIFDQLDSGLDKAKQFTHEFRNHLLFLDAELAYPTSSGVPLKLNIQGASAVKLGFGGNIDIRRIIQDPHNAKIDLEIVPSANIELSSYFYADADLVSSGLKVISTLYTATGSHLVVKVLDNGKGIDIQLGLPVEKQEILSATHEIVFTTSGKGQQESDVALKFDVDRRELQGCFDQLAPALGLTFCGDVSLPVVNPKSKSGQSLQKLAASFPFSGPAKISVRLEKEDLKGYHFKGLLNDKDPHQRSVELVFEAEGSKNNRRTSLLAEVTNRDTEKGVKVEIKSPLKNVAAHALLLNTDKEKSASLKLTNDNDEYFGKLGVAQSGGGGDKIVYTPLIEYRNPKQQSKTFNVEGNIVIENISGGRKYTFNGVRFVNSNEQTQIDGFISRESQGISTDLKVIQGKHSANLNGKVNVLPNGIKLNIEFHNTLNPNIGFLITYEGVKEEGHVQNDLVFVHGPDSKSASKKFTVNQNVKYHHKSSSDFDIITKNKISYPAVNLNIKVEAELNPKKVDIDVETKYDKTVAEFEIEGRGDTKKRGDYSVKFEAKVNANEIEFVSKRDIIEDDKSNWQNHLEIKPGGRYELNGVVNHKIKPNDLNVGVVGHLKVAGRDDNYNFDVTVVSNPTVYNSHAKVSVGTVDYLDLNAKINRGDTPNGSLKVLVKGIVNAQGQFKANKADGKGNGAIIIELVRVQRKLKAESNFLIHEHQYNSNIDIYLDFEKDNSNKIQLNTNTKAQDLRNFESKNSLVVGERKTDVHLKSEHSGSFADGKTLLLTEVTLNSGRVLTLKYDRNVVGKDNEHVNGDIEILISDAKQKGAETSKLQLLGKITDLNTKLRTFTHDAHLTVSLTSGKNLEVVSHTQHLAKGDRKTIDYKIDVTGNTIPKAVSLVLSSDYSREKENDKDGKYRLKVTYGGETGFDGNGKIALKKSPDGTRRYDTDVQVNILLPFEKAHDIKLRLTEGLAVPKNSEGVLEGKSTASLQVNADEYKYDVQGKLSRELVELSLTAAVPHHEPYTLETRTKRQFQGDVAQASSLLRITHGKKQLVLEADGKRKADREYDGKINVKLPENEKVKDISLQIHHDHEVPETHKSKIVITVDGKAYKLDNVLVAKKSEPLFDLKLTRPDNTVSRIFTKSQVISDKHYTSEAKIENVRGLDLVSSVDVNVVSQDEFVLKADVDSEKLKLKKVHIEINTKSEGGSKKIIFAATSDGQNVISGSTSYLKKQEGSKTIVEGSGTVKVRDEEKAASFKYIREAINEPLEQGVEVLLKTELGQKSILVEHKATNIEYKYNNVYCEEKQQCAVVELSAKLNKPGPDQLQHSLQVLVDLRKLGISPEFGLQSNADLHRNRPPVLTFDIYLNQDKSKYHLHAYSQPTKGAYPAGISLTLPQRVISLEQSLTYTEGKTLPLPIKGEIAFYLNKKSEPNQKAGIRFDADLQRVEGKSLTALGDIVLSHPALGKDLQITTKSVYDVQTHSVNSNLILDIFKKKNQRVTISGKLNSNYVDRQSVNITSELDISGKGLGIELLLLQHLAVSREEIGAGINVALTQDKQRREAGALLHASRQDVRLQVKAPSVTLVNLDGRFDINPEAPVVDLTVTLLQDKAVFMHAEAKRLESFEISTGYKNAPENKLSVSGRLKPFERIEVRAEIVKGNQKQDLVHAAVFLQDDVPKSDCGISTENIKIYVEHLRSDVKSLLDRSKQLSSQLTSQAQKDASKTGQILKNAVPDIKHVGDYYKSELEKIKNEVVNDKTLQEMNQFVKNFVQSLAKIISDLVNNLTSIAEQTKKVLTETYEKVANVLNEKVIPQLKDLADSLVGTVTELANAIVDLVAHYVVLVTNFIEKHKGEFKELTAAINDLTRDVTKLIAKRLAEIRKDLSALSAKIKEQIESLPIIQMLREKWEEFTLPEQLVTILTEVTNALKAILPNEELKNLVDVIHNYVTKKIQREQVNDSEELQNIYQKLVAVIKSLAEQLRGQVGEYNVGSLFGLNLVSAVIPRLPVIPAGGSLSFSFLNYFREESDSFKDFLKSYQAIRPRAGLVPPFKGNAYISDGGHIFTFDGKHLTFPGTCKYILAHDSVDGNFTIAANLNNGVLKSLVLVDQTGNVVEIKDNGQLLLNNAVNGYPVDTKDIAAWRDYAGISVLSYYGVKIRCTSNLKFCMVRVSGFYFGKTRGLLGDLNNEPYDDFKIPNGKVATSESEFGNAYRVTSSCPAAKAVEHTSDHEHTPSPVCDDIFNGEVSFKACRYTVNIDNFRTACHHATLAHPERAEEEACKIAFAYATACHSSGLHNLMRSPPRCAVCKEGKNTYKIGESFEVSLPQKQADIIVAVKLTKDNEQAYKDLVVPLVSQLVDELKAKKIDDIKVKLVGISTKIPHAIWYDTDNNKLKGAKIKFQEPTKLDPLTLPVTNNERIDNFIHKLGEALQPVRGMITFTNARGGISDLFNIPLRPHAIKTGLLFAGDVCPKLELYKVPFNLEIIGKLFAHGISMNVFTGLEDIEVPDVDTKELVGLSHHDVILLSGKKSLESKRSPIGIKTVCDSMAKFSRGGNLFSVNSFTALGAPQRKQYIQQATRVIVEQSAKELQTKCSCELKQGLFPNIDCHITSLEGLARN